MPQDLSDSVSGSTELVFPDGATGRYRLDESSVYGADEVREELGGDVPKYGSWLPVEETDTGDEAWLIAPSNLRKVLDQDDIRPGELFEIVTLTKTGTEQSDPYRVQVEYPERDGDARQSGLSSA